MRIRLRSSALPPPRSGDFQLPPVPPGRYEITASMAGFATTKLTGLALELAESKVIELVIAAGVGA